MSREGKLAKNTAILAIGTFLPKLGAFVVLPILTGYLTKEELGTYDLVLVLVSFILPAVTLEIQTAAFRFLIDVRDKKEEIKSIITNIFAFITVTSIVALVFTYFLLPLTSSNTKLIICAYFLVDILVNATRQCARGLAKNKDYTVSAIISSSFKILLVIVFVWYFKAGLFGAFAALLGATTISFIILSVRIRIYSYFDIRLINKTKIIEMLTYSWPMVPNSVSFSIMRASDRFVVTLFMGVAANAVYAVANKIPNILSLAQTTFTMAWQENASVVSKDLDAKAYYSSMFHKMFDLVAGFLGVLICCTPFLFKLLIRGDYAEAYNQMPILFLAMFFYSMCGYLGGIYVAYKHTKNIGITTMVAAACNLIVDLSLIKTIGLYAASGSTLISYLLLFIFRMYDVRKLVRIKYNYGHIILVLLILCIESALCFFKRPVFDITNILLGCCIFFVLNRETLKIFYKKFVNFLRKR